MDRSPFTSAVKYPLVDSTTAVVSPRMRVDGNTSLLGLRAPRDRKRKRLQYRTPSCCTSPASSCPRKPCQREERVPIQDCIEVFLATTGNTGMPRKRSRSGFRRRGQDTRREFAGLRDKISHNSLSLDCSSPRQSAQWSDTSPPNFGLPVHLPPPCPNVIDAAS
jgi:hypothetical protein